MMTIAKSKKRKTPAPMISFADYNRILRGLNLVDMRLVESECEAEKGTSSRILTAEVKYAPTIVNVIKEAVRISVGYEFIAIDKESENRVVRIAARYDIMLKSQEEFTEHFFEVYKNISLPINVWPYFREYVHSMLSRMGFAPFTLPFHKGLGGLDDTHKSAAK